MGPFVSFATYRNLTPLLHYAVTIDMAITKEIKFQDMQYATCILTFYFCHATLHIAWSIVLSFSVHPSVTFVYCIKTSTGKYILKHFFHHLQDKPF